MGATIEYSVLGQKIWKKSNYLPMIRLAFDSIDSKSSIAVFIQSSDNETLVLKGDSFPDMM
jgi:hypothetical protein